MKLPSFDFVQAAGVRRAVVPEGDIRGDIAFQNDINGLLARFDAQATPPLKALGWIREPVAPALGRPRDALGSSKRTLRFIDEAAMGSSQARNDTADIAAPLSADARRG